MSHRRLQALFQRECELDAERDELAVRHLMYMSLREPFLPPNALWNLAAHEARVWDELEAVRRKLRDARAFIYTE